MVLAVNTTLMFVGFYLFYVTSTRMVFPENMFHTYVQDHILQIRIWGVILILLSIAGMIWDQGMGAGLFFGLFIFMTVASLIILLSPLFNKRGK